MLAFYLIFICLNIALAYHDAKLIKQGYGINHTINTLLYIIASGAAACYMSSIDLLLSLILIRIPIFNTSLNLFRGLPYDYHNPQSGSVIDFLFDECIVIFGYTGYNIFIIILSLILLL